MRRQGAPVVVWSLSRPSVRRSVVCCTPDQEASCVVPVGSDPKYVVSVSHACQLDKSVRTCSSSALFLLLVFHFLLHFAFGSIPLPKRISLFLKTVNYGEYITWPLFCITYFFLVSENRKYI